MKNKKKILILGAGFSGVTFALNLEKKARDLFDISILSKNNHMEYFPALYKIATGKNPLEVCLPLDTVFKNKSITFSTDDINRISFSDKKVYGNGSEYSYDVLVMALGSEANFFGIPGVDTGTFAFKSINDAIKLNKHLHKVFSRHAQFDQDKKDENLHFVIVGGGPSGLELAGEFSCYLKTLATNHKIAHENLHIDLIDSGKKLLATFPEIVSDIVHEKLYKLGVNIFLNHKVSGQVGNSLKAGDLEIKSETIVWTAGVSPNRLYSQTDGLALDHGRVKVDGYFKAVGQGDVFVLGDGAFIPTGGTAQNAISNARFLARHLARMAINLPTPKYHLGVNHLVLPIKKNWGLLYFHGFVLTGRIAFWIRELIDLYFFLQILPIRQAFSLWREGKRICESCPVCSNKDNN